MIHAFRRAVPALFVLLLCASCARDTGGWNDVLDTYRKDASVRELLLVACRDGSEATVSYYGKAFPRRWVLRGRGEAYVGRNGLGKTREGDAKTPVGDFGVLTAFGILPDPGTALPWLPVTTSTFACDEEGPWYNRIVDTAATHHPCKGEDMFHTAPEYNYGLALDFNADCRYPEGSAIFFHCKGAKTWTGGCVAVDEAFMRRILTSCHPGLRVIIR